MRAAGILLFTCAAFLAGCGGGGGSTGPASHHGTGPYTRTSSGPTQGYYKIGQPYQIDGTTYTPAVDYDYDETGIASWYGPNFDGKITANGELYDMNEVTGAHRTLPMPSLVRVTNLDNGRTIVVRVNDRGPYARGRILDMSRRGAQLLGYEKTGTAKVRVQIMARESQILAQAAKQGKLTIDVAGLDNEAPPLPAGTPTYTRPGSVAQAPPPPRQYVPPPQQVRPSAIYVQAGSFGVEENAQRLKAKLAGVGRTDVFVANVDGKTFYRVRVGPVANVDQADELLSRVVGAGANGAKIVVN